MPLLFTRPVDHLNADQLERQLPAPINTGLGNTVHGYTEHRNTGQINTGLTNTGQKNIGIGNT